LAAAALATAWLAVDGAAAVNSTTEAIRFNATTHHRATPPIEGRTPDVVTVAPPRARLVRIDYVAPTLRDRVLAADAFVPSTPPPPGGYHLAVLLHGVPGAPSDWMVGGDLDDVLPVGVLAVIPPTAGFHNGRAPWNDEHAQRTLTAVRRDLLDAVARRYPVDLRPGRVAVIGVGGGGDGALRLARADARVGYVVALGPHRRVAVPAGVHVFLQRADRRRHATSAARWTRWRAELPGAFSWLAQGGFDATR
jgi:hypothetical protein